jgi:hypothetical protein
LFVPTAHLPPPPPPTHNLSLDSVMFKFNSVLKFTHLFKSNFDTLFYLLVRETSKFFFSSHFPATRTVDIIVLNLNIVKLFQISKFSVTLSLFSTSMLLNTLLSKTAKLYSLLKGRYRHPVKPNGESWSKSLILRKCKHTAWQFYSVSFNAALTLAEQAASSVAMQQQCLSSAAHRPALK